MTVSSTLSKKVYNGDGNEMTFPTEFAFLANADVTATLTDANGVETTWIEGTHYTLSGAGSGSAGTLTVISPPSSNIPKLGETLTIRRVPEATQNTDLPVGDSLSAEVLEQALDRGVMLTQRTLEELDRAIKLPVAESGAGTLPSIGSRSGKLAGWDSSGDWTALTADDDSTNTATATGGTTARSHADRFADVVNVKDYGAVGDGLTDDTAAVNAAWTAYKNATAFAEVSGSTWQDIKKAALYFPPGDYVFDPTASGALDPGGEMPLIVMGAGRRATRIQLTGAGYLIDFDRFAQATHIANLTIDGGKGLFRHARTSENVAGHHIFENLDMIGYSECAIGSLSSNMPRWGVRNCLFQGTTTSIGLAVPVQAREVDIRFNVFRKNKYHLKIPLDTNAQLVGPNNSYISLGAGEVVAKVWLVGTKNSDNNAGEGLTLFAEQFSNENFQEGDFTILVAEEDTGSGADFMSRSHATTDASGHWLNGVRIVDCVFGATGNASSEPSNRGVVFSYLSRVAAMKFIDCYHTGGWFPYWLEFASGVTPFTNVGVQNLNIIHGCYSDRSLNPPEPCNVAGIVRQFHDDFAFLGGLDQFDVAGADDVNFTEALTNLDPNNWALAAGGGTAPTKVPTADALGGSLAAEVTFADGLGNIKSGLTESNMIGGALHFAEFDIKAGTSSSLLRALIMIQEGGGTHILAEKVVTVTSQAQRIRIPFTASAAPTSAEIKIAAGNFYSASTNKLIIGRPSVYRANAPKPYPRPLSGTLVWDPANLADGAGETSSAITVDGAAFGDTVEVAAPYDLQGIAATAYVSVANAVKIRIQNETGGAIDLASGTWTVWVRKR